MPNLREKTWTSTTPANVEDAQFWEDHLISNEDASKLENITGVPDGGSSGQVLTRTTSGIDWRDPASSGHTIQNAAGVDMPYQGTLQFLGADVANDSVNGKTVVDCHGEKGDAATIAAGTVTILPAGSTPTVTNSGTSSTAVFDFGIPSSDGSVSAGQQSLLNDTVGWTGKNRAYSQTNNAVIAHIENGITYDVSWTGSATVTLKKNSASGATITSGSTSPLSFTADADYELYFGSSATVTNIMVKDSRIVDPTYEPYHESVEEEIEQIYADNGVLGAKNLLPYPFANTTKTSSGVTFTDNGDGSVTVNGTASAQTEFIFVYPWKPTINAPLIVTGVPSGARGDLYLIQIYDQNPNTVTYNVTENGMKIPSLAGRTWVVKIMIRVNAVCNNLVFKPMISLASDPDDTYQPYAMTNRELTEIKVYDANSAGFSAPNVTIDWTKSTMKKCGNICYFGFLITANNAISQYATVIQLPDEMKSKQGARFMPTGTYPCVMNESGNIYAANTISQGSSSWYLSGTYII